MITQEILKKYVGIPYQQIGNCWKFIVIFFREFNIEIPDINEECLMSIDGKNSFYQEQKNNWPKINMPQPLDVVLFRNSTHLHAGVMISGNKFIHAWQGFNDNGQVCITELGRIKKENLIGFYRYRDVILTQDMPHSFEEMEIWEKAGKQIPILYGSILKQ